MLNSEISQRSTSALNQSSTQVARRRAVERVVGVLRQRFADPLSLQELSRIAISSPFHFNRVFREVTGLPPGRFLSAVRLDAAKRLLVTTHESVTRICYKVGYSSLGSFTTHFTQFVGVSPRQLRRMVRQSRSLPQPIEEFMPGAADSGAELTGTIRVPSGFRGKAMVGIFASPLPRGRPVACAMASAPGDYRVRAVPDGCWYVLVLGLSNDELPADSSVQSLLRGRSGPCLVREGCAEGTITVSLREPWMTDPPVLVSLALLFNEHSAPS